MAEKKNSVSPEEETLVRLRIPRERSDQEDVFVRVNQRTWQIQRGVEVEVPACVAEVLRHREEMLDVIWEFEAKNAK